MINKKESTKISKFLSLVLRHSPESINIDLDPEGWANIDVLIERLKAKKTTIDIDILNHIVESSEKQRFAISEDGKFIRANQGHSINVDHRFESVNPPEILFHGTAQKAVKSILNTGIDKRSRHHVHLSTDIETATKVGQRHGKPVILKVLATKMHEDGFLFYLSENGVWLTYIVPAKYIKLEQ